MTTIQRLEGGRIDNEQMKRKNENEGRKNKIKIRNLKRKTASIEENREKI